MPPQRASSTSARAGPRPPRPVRSPRTRARRRRCRRRRGPARDGADDADAADDRRLPPNGDCGRRSADQPGDAEADNGIDEVVERRRGGGREIERGDRARDRRERRLRATLPLVEIEADGEQSGRADVRQRNARRLVDPAAADRGGDEERDADHDRDRAEPAEDAAAEQVLEIPVEAAGGRRRRLGGRPERRQRCRRGAGAGAGGGSGGTTRQADERSPSSASTRARSSSTTRSSCSTRSSSYRIFAI